jgi:hypothetical protein
MKDLSTGQDTKAFTKVNESSDILAKKKSPRVSLRGGNNYKPFAPNGGDSTRSSNAALLGNSKRRLSNQGGSVHSKASFIEVVQSLEEGL